MYMYGSCWKYRKLWITNNNPFVEWFFGTISTHVLIFFCSRFSFVIQAYSVAQRKETTGVTVIFRTDAPETKFIGAGSHWQGLGPHPLAREICSFWPFKRPKIKVNPSPGQRKIAANSPLGPSAGKNSCPHPWTHFWEYLYGCEGRGEHWRK